jgi:hypothetical protein
VTDKNFGCKLPVRVPQIQWQRSYGGRGCEDKGFTLQTVDGGYAVTFHSYSSPTFGSSDYRVIRLDALGNELWQHNFGGPSLEWLHDFKSTFDQGFILCGLTTSGAGGNKTSPGIGGVDTYLVRLDANGVKAWETELGGTGNDAWPRVLETVDHGFLVCGTSGSGMDGNKTSPQYGGGDGWVIRLDRNGLIQWQLTYGGTALDYADFAVENPVDGSFLVSVQCESGPSGNKTSPNYGLTDYGLVKIDSAGNFVWDRSYGGTGNDELSGFAPTSNGGGVLGGSSGSFGGSGNRTAPLRGDQDIWAVRVDSDGNILGDHSYGGDLISRAYDLKAMPDGGIVFVGLTRSPRSGNKVSPFFGGRWDGWLVRTDAAGNNVWDEVFGGTGTDYFQGVTVTQDGGLILTGITYSNDGIVTVPHYGEGDIWLIKLAPLSCTANPLTLVSATGDCVAQRITVNFSAALEPGTALQATNYTVTGGAVSVEGARFGAHTLTVDLDVQGLLPGVAYTLSASGLGDDCGNPIAPDANLPVAACPGEIRGKVFSDQDTSCVEDPGEFRLLNWPVMLEPGPRFTLTDAAGNYTFAVPPGDYTVRALPDSRPRPRWQAVCPSSPDSYSVTLDSGQIVDDENFSFVALETPCPDLWVDLTTIPGGGSTPSWYGLQDHRGMSYGLQVLKA